MANVAHFMCELATSEAAWGRWKGRFPVIIDVSAEPRDGPRSHDNTA